MRPVRPVRRSVLAAAGSLSILAGLLPPLVAPLAAATPVFINEIHYDDASTDSGEMIEVAGPAGTNLSGWSLVLYNGNGGGSYSAGGEDPVPLSGVITDSGSGFGTASVAAVGLQNGSPDGIALVNGSTVVQFLSYEGTFTATNGPATGMTSTDIGVAETGSAPDGISLGLTGTGTTYEDFTWTAGLNDSFGDPNPGQSFGSAPENAPVEVTCGNAITTVAGYSASRTITASDPDGTVLEINLESVAPSNADITVGSTTAATMDGDEASATLTVDTETAGIFTATVAATNDDAEPQSATCTLTVTVLPIRHIGEVQGAVDGDDNGLTHRSPFAPRSGNGAGQTVAVRGVVAQLTLAREADGDLQHGFFLQEAAGSTDGDPNTSDGIWIFMGRFDDLIDGYVPTVGDEVVLTGRATEFFNLTQLSSARSWDVIRQDVEVAPFEVDPPANLFAANQYWERREGMQAQVPAGSLVQGGRSVFGSTYDAEIYLIRGDYAPITARTDPYERRVFRDAHPLDDISDQLWDNGNGFRFLLGSLGVKATTGDATTLLPPARTFDTLTNSPAGGVYFGFSKYQIQVATQPTFDAGVDPSLNGAPQPHDPEDEWVSSTYNVENLYDYRDDPTDGCDFTGNDGCAGVNPPFDYVPLSEADYQAHLTALATQIAEDLHGPDLIMVQEAEDQDICRVDGGALACNQGDGQPDTLQDLTLRIASLGGPQYAAVYDRDGADDRGIVSAFLYRRDRVELLPASADDPVLGSDQDVAYRGTPLAYNEDIQNPKALNADLPSDVDTSTGTDGSNVFTRPPQVGHFRVWRDGIGTSVWVDTWAVSNHFSSTPDRRVGQRTEQAAYLAAIVDAIEAEDPDARVVVGGDFNVFPRPDDPFAPGHRLFPSDQLAPLYDQGLGSLWEFLAEELPEAAYSYVFQGQAQTLDTQFVSDDLLAEFIEYRVAHINADWAADHEGDGARGASDHDPSHSRYELDVTLDRLVALVA